MPYRKTAMEAVKSVFKFEAVPGIFAQSLPDTSAATFDYTKNEWIVIGHGEQAPWQKVLEHIQSLQKSASVDTQYKLIINGRHGQGFHNVAEDTYGTAAWDEHWSKLEGTGDVSWADSHLTALGEQQAHDANAFLATQLARGMPAPQRFIVSPLYRCLQTAYLTWSHLELPKHRAFKPVVKEMIREVMGEHTCDRRSAHTELRSAFPEASFEDGFVEEDRLWRADHRETHAEHDLRTQLLLDDVFANDASTVISFTSHSGSIASLLRVLGHREFRLQTGAIIPLLVKATRL